MPISTPRALRGRPRSRRRAQGAIPNDKNPTLGRDEPGDHGVGRSRGGLSTKAHALVDGKGRLLTLIVGPGHAGDSPVLPLLLGELRVARRGPGRPPTTPDVLRADKAYCSRGHRALLRSRGIKTVIPEKADQAAHRKRRGSAGGRPVSHDVGELQEPQRRRTLLQPHQAALNRPGKEIPDGHVFTQPSPQGPNGTLRSQVTYYQYGADRARRSLRGIDEQVSKAEKAVAGKTPVKRNRFITITGGSKKINRDLEAKDRALAGIKGYVTNIANPTPEFVINAYHQLWHIEKSFRMSKHDLRARPIYHHKRESFEAHLTVVFAALAVTRLIEDRTG